MAGRGEEEEEGVGRGDEEEEGVGGGGVDSLSQQDEMLQGI